MSDSVGMPGSPASADELKARVKNGRRGCNDARLHLAMREQSAKFEHNVTPPVDSLLFFNPHSNHSLRTRNIECLNVAIRRLNLDRPWHESGVVAGFRRRYPTA